MNEHCSRNLVLGPIAGHDKEKQLEKEVLSPTAAPRFTTPSLPALAKLIRYGEITGIASTQMLDFDCLDVIIICFAFHPRRTWRVAVQLALEKERTSRDDERQPTSCASKYVSIQTLELSKGISEFARVSDCRFSVRYLPTFRVWSFA